MQGPQTRFESRQEGGGGLSSVMGHLNVRRGERGSGEINTVRKKAVVRL